MDKRKKYNLEFIISFCEQRDIDLLSKTYQNCDKKLVCQCKKCFYVWNPSFYFLYKKNSGCPKCQGNARLSFEEIKRRIKNIHGDNIVLDESTYKSLHGKAKFIDKNYGEWWTTPSIVINQKSGHPLKRIKKIQETNLKKYGYSTVLKNKSLMKKAMFSKYGAIHPMHLDEVKQKLKQTNLQRYGVDNPTKNKEIRRKAAVSANKTTKIVHWKTNENIDMLGWEPQAATHFNTNKIDYLYEPETFTLPDGTTYTPDFYLPEKDLYIEVKGRFIGDAREKWNWFHKEYSNSELWDRAKLKEMKIL